MLLYISVFKAKHFESLGKLIAMSLSQDGSGFPFLSATTYKYIVGGDISRLNPTDEEVPDIEIRQLVALVRNASAV